MGEKKAKGAASAAVLQDMNANNTETWKLYINRLAARTGVNADVLSLTEGQRILMSLKAAREKRALELAELVVNANPFCCYCGREHESCRCD